MSLQKELLNFIIHLRLHYQIFLLSGGYLLALLYTEDVNWQLYLTQFINVHVFLFGGATAYNSFFDKDKGAIGGLKNPPPMDGWMWLASWVWQLFGLAWAFTVNLNFTVVYVASMLLFWLYSSPKARWKGRPNLSLVAIGGSTGFASFMLGYLATGSYPITWIHDLAALGVSLIILSLYPVSQIYQMVEDEERGDVTFCMHYGLSGVKYFYLFSFPVGLSLISYSLFTVNEQLAMIFFVLGVIIFGVIWLKIRSLTGKPAEYQKVMVIKLLTSLGFVLFILSSVLIKSII